MDAFYLVMACVYIYTDVHWIDIFCSLMRKPVLLLSVNTNSMQKLKRDTFYWKKYKIDLVKGYISIIVYNSID
jgi:hypothetical protein